MDMKYIIAQLPVTGFLLPVTFPDEITHSTIATAVRYEHKRCEIIGAGFFNTKTIVPYGYSESLKIGPGECDTLVLQLFLQKGLSGLALHNELMLCF